jgi:hypothetical protein
MDGAPQTTTVARIAMEYGFWELGRFAVRYRELFRGGTLSVITPATA